MADRNDSDLIEAEDPAHIRRKLTKRMVLAMSLIVVLLGALAVFDHLSKVDEEAEDVAAPPARPPQVGPSLRSEGKPEEPAPPPLPEPPPKPEIPAQPSAAPPPTVPPAAVPPAAVKPPAGVARPAPAPLPRPAPAVPEGSAAPGAPAAAPAPVPPPRPAPPRLGFLLQAGVFSSHERALELKARLDEAGIPASIESRVQVGPFASKKEAEAARAKMKLLGIDALPLPPRAISVNGQR